MNSSARRLIRNPLTALVLNYLVLLFSFGVQAIIMFFSKFIRVSHPYIEFHFFSNIGQQLALIAIPALMNSLFAGLIWIGFCFASWRLIDELSVRQFLFFQAAYIAPMVLLIILETFRVNNLSLAAIFPGLIVPCVFVCTWAALSNLLSRNNTDKLE
jgi:hypothetical protein